MLSRRVITALLIVSACLLVQGCQQPQAPSNAPQNTPATEPAEEMSAGERIYVEGVGLSGRPIERTDINGALVTSGSSCAICHGDDGRGVGEAPAVDLATLRSQRDILRHTSAVTGPRLVLVHEKKKLDDEEPSAPGDEPEAPSTVGPWTDAQILDVIRTGRTPEGFRILAEMPRWRIDDADGAALLEYLGEL